MSVAPVLSELFGCHAARFCADHWPGSRMAVHRDLDALPAPLRSPRLLDPRQLTAVYRGTVEVTNGRGGQFRVTGPDPRVYFETLDLAVRLSDIDSYLPGATAWLRALEHALGVPTGCASMHAFINASGVGLAAHCDPGEHIAIQITGTKRFRVRDNPAARFMDASHAPSHAPCRRAVAAGGARLPAWSELPNDADDITMRPGSISFLPRGTYHETRAGTGVPATTVVIRIATPSYADLVLDYLADYLAQAETWREPAVGARADASDTRVCDGLRARLSALSERIDTLSPQHILCAGDRRAAPAPVEHAWLVRDRAVAVDIREVARGLALRAGRGDDNAAIELPADTGPVLAWLADPPDRFTVATLSEAFADWERDSLVSLVHFLVKRGALVVFPVEAYADLTQQ